MTQAQLDNLKGHEFKKGQSGNPKGRPKNRVLALLKEELPKKSVKAMEGSLTRNEIDTIEKKALQLRFSDLQIIAGNDKVYSYLRSIAIAILMDTKNGRTTVVDKLRERQYNEKDEEQQNGSVDFLNNLIATGKIGDYGIEITEDDYEEDDDEED